MIRAWPTLLERFVGWLAGFMIDLGALRVILLFLLNSIEISHQFLMASSCMADVAAAVDAAAHEDASPFEPMLDKVPHYFSDL